MDSDAIPVMWPRLPSFEDFRERLTQIESARIYSNFGPQVAEYEARISDFLGVKASQVVTIANATLGIAGVVSLFSEISEWGVPSWTFTASVGGILAGGSTPVFLDLGDDSHWVSDENLHSRDPLVVVAPFGAPVPAELRNRRAPTIIDAAASLGSQSSFSCQLADSNFMVFSLHATKVLGAGEGAIVVCGSDESAKQLRSWANFGFDSSRSSIRVGTNAKLSEFAAVVAHASLDNWETERAEWVEARSAVRNIISKTGFSMFDVPGDFVSPYWVVDFVDESLRYRVERVMAECKIGTRRWWSDGCHRMPAYLDFLGGPLPNTEKWAARHLGLPFFRGMTADHLGRISTALDEIRGDFADSRSIEKGIQPIEDEQDPKRIRRFGL